jgi:hypothetical protein
MRRKAEVDRVMLARLALSVLLIFGLTLVLGFVVVVRSVSESSIPSPVEFIDPEGVQSVGDQRGCGSGGCWTEATVIFRDATLASEFVGDHGIAVRDCRLSFRSMRVVCSWVHSADGRSVVVIGKYWTLFE